MIILLFQRAGTITGGFNFYFGQSYHQTFNSQLKEQVNASLSYLKYNCLNQQLTIKAQDLGSPSLSSEKTITVALKNINDNSPIFVEVCIFYIIYYINLFKTGRPMAYTACSKKGRGGEARGTRGRKANGKGPFSISPQSPLPFPPFPCPFKGLSRR